VFSGLYSVVGLLFLLALANYDELVVQPPLPCACAACFSRLLRFAVFL
jgi:hypothetical protein